MAAVVSINPFEVPEGKQDECLTFWESVAEYMKTRPGLTSQGRCSERHERFIQATTLAEWRIDAYRPL